jgi:hypothetical protein
MTMLEYVSEVTELNDISAYMQDKDLDDAMDIIIKLIAKPDVPAAKVPEVIVRLQAISAKLAIMARYYTTFEKGPEASKKKNVYYTTADAIDKLVAALKYGMKQPY